VTRCTLSRFRPHGLFSRQGEEGNFSLLDLPVSIWFEPLGYYYLQDVLITVLKAKYSTKGQKKAKTVDVILPSDQIATHLRKAAEICRLFLSLHQ